MISAMAGIRAILDLPDHFRVDLIMPVGTPAPKATRRSLPSVRNPVHRNGYGLFADG